MFPRKYCAFQNTGHLNVRVTYTHKKLSLIKYLAIKNVFTRGGKLNFGSHAKAKFTDVPLNEKAKILLFPSSRTYFRTGLDKPIPYTDSNI